MVLSSTCIKATPTTASQIPRCLQARFLVLQPDVVAYGDLSRLR